MTTNSNPLKSFAAALATALGLACAVGSASAATIVINNINAAGIGFNDTTPAAPVGGNPGLTLGEQRLFAFTYAANLWGATLTSNQPIVINAQFSALTCTATSAVLGSAGSTSVFRDFGNALKPATWYSYALANKLSGTYLGTANAPQINANFNVNLGKANCLTGSFFYLGVDNHAGTSVDFVEVLLHEMGHGIGFQTFTSGLTGTQLNGFPSIWDHYMFDESINKLWVNMTDVERQTSAVSPRKLAWTGSIVTSLAPQVLSVGTPALNVSGPAAGTATGSYLIGDATFGVPLSTTPVTGQLMPVVDQADGTGLACTALSAVNALAVKGNVALVDRGVCSFVIKAKIVQDAGAIAMIVADNAAGSPPAGISGTDPTVVIPSIRITQADGVTLKAQLKRRSRTTSGVLATLVVAGSQLTGANRFGQVLLYTPNPFQSGSSVSHWDTSATRNLLMEPSINADLTQSVIPPQDLTFPLLRDIGW